MSTRRESYNLKEERDLRLIKDGLKHNGDHWVAQYSWIRDPLELPDNYSAALAMLEKLEKRLQKNKSHAQIYQEQVEDMISRRVARKLTKEEVKVIHFSTMMSNQSSTWKTTTPIKLDGYNLQTNSSISIL